MDEEFIATMAAYLSQGQPLEQLVKIRILLSRMLLNVDQGILVFERHYKSDNASDRWVPS